MSILKYFPPNLVPRSVQTELLGEIQQKLDSGFKKIILCAPAGVGKSAIGITIGNYFGNSFMVTASKQLQDQYITDYPHLNSVKGKSNFPCLKLMEEKKIEDSILANTLGLTCEKGKCEEKKIGSKIIYCKFKPELKNLEKEVPTSDLCHYYLQKYIALLSNHSLWNYHSFFQLMLNKKPFSQYVGKTISIFDEAHRIEDQIINFIGIKITNKQLEECNIEFERYDLNDIDNVLEMIDNMRTTYAEVLSKMENEKNDDQPAYVRYLEQLERGARIHKNISNDKENYVINEPQKDIDGKLESVEIKPVDISKFIESFFDTEYQLFMSATIDKKSFCENMGFTETNTAFIETSISPFPIENRKVEFLDIKKINRFSSFEDKIQIVKQIDHLLDNHSQERGLILTSSISNCFFIKKYLSLKNRERIRICHSHNQNEKTQEQILKEHENNPTSVLLSSSLWEGVDLKDDLSRFQIIAKIPYPSLSEKRTAVKMKKFSLWYDSQTLMKLLQGFGRSIRNENDYAKTYVLDSAVHYLVKKTREIIPKAYYDSLKL